MTSPGLQNFESNESIPLSPVERMYWRVEENLLGSCRIVVLVRLHGCIEADLLSVALQHIQWRHPKLRSAITEGADGVPRYQFGRQVPPIQSEITDYDGDESPWREEIRRLMQLRFPPGGPLAVVAVLRNRSQNCSVLILSAHHAILDGASGILLIDDLLTEYARVETHSEEDPRPALPAVSAMRAKPSGGWFGRLRLLRRFMRLQRREKRSPQTSLPEAPGISVQPQRVHWVLSPEDTTRLLRRCRDEQASLGGALVAAVYCGLMDCLPVSEAFFKCQLPFDLRDQLEGSSGTVTARDLGCFLSLMNEFHHVPQPPAFWDLARSTHLSIQTFVRNGGPSFGYNLSAIAAKRIFVGASRKLLASRGKRLTLLVTNMGLVDLRDRYGSLHPQDCIASFNNDVIGPTLALAALTMGQRLNIGLAGGNLDPEFWQRLQIAVRRRLDVAVGIEQTAPITSTERIVWA